MTYTNIELRSKFDGDSEPVLENRQRAKLTLHERLLTRAFRPQYPRHRSPKAETFPDDFERSLEDSNGKFPTEELRGGLRKDFILFKN